MCCCVGNPLFSGNTEQEQIAYIMEIQGIPDKRLLEEASRRQHFFGMAFLKLATTKNAHFVIRCTWSSKDTSQQQWQTIPTTRHQDISTSIGFK